jgi:hypothetical protein
VVNVPDWSARRDAAAFRTTPSSRLAQRRTDLDVSNEFSGDEMTLRGCAHQRPLERASAERREERRTFRRKVWRTWIA